MPVQVWPGFSYTIRIHLESINVYGTIFDSKSFLFSLFIHILCTSDRIVSVMICSSIVWRNWIIHRLHKWWAQFILTLFRYLLRISSNGTIHQLMNNWLIIILVLISFAGSMHTPNINGSSIPKGPRRLLILT